MREEGSCPPSLQDGHNDRGVVEMCTNRINDRRQRLHDLLLALVAQQGDLELMDVDNPSGLVSGGSRDAPADAARWLERNRRVLQRYQALVRTAVTLDALLDAEDGIAQDPS